MAGELSVIAPTGATVYAVLLSPFGDSGGKFYKVSTGQFETFATWADYVIPMTEVTGAGIYLASMPTGRGMDGWEFMDVIYYSQGGGSPDVGDTKLAAGRVRRIGGAWMTQIG